MEHHYFRPKLPNPAMPFESLFLALKLMPEDVASSDWAAWSEILGTLTPRERVVLDGRLGLAGGPRLTLQEVGTQLGITREWVRQLQERALRRLRRCAVEQGLIRQGAPDRLSYWWRDPYWPPGTARGAPR